MGLSISDFFTADNIVGNIEPKEYDNIQIYIDSARAFARSFYQPVFIVDFHRKDLFYLSGNLQYLCGIKGEDMDSRKNNLYFNAVPENEWEMLKEIIRKAFELFHTFPPEERQDMILSYYFHLENEGRRRLIHHKVTPLKLSPDGKVWLAACTFSMSSRKEAGYPVMRKCNETDYFFYSLDKHVWYHREGMSLTTMERDVLMLSSQGYTMKEIADRLCRSEDSIKSYKRVLFSKLGVRNITEAVFAAINYDLFH